MVLSLESNENVRDHKLSYEQKAIQPISSTSDVISTYSIAFERNDFSAIFLYLESL